MCMCNFAIEWDTMYFYVFVCLLHVYVWMFSNVFVSMCTYVLYSPCVYFPRSCVYFLPPTCRDTSWLSEVETIGDIPVSASNRNWKPSWICFLERSWRSRLSRSPLAPTCCAFELSTVENIFAAPPAKCDRKSSIELEVGCWLADIWISIFR